MTQGTVAGIGSHTESEEDLLAKSEVHKNHKNLEKSFRYSQSLSNGTTQKIMDSFLYQNGNIELPSAGCIGRVRSVLSARSFATPEKLILEPEPDSRIHLESVAGALASSGRAKTFPQGSRTVTIPRGDKGFGFIMVEKKVLNNIMRNLQIVDTLETHPYVPPSLCPTIFMSHLPYVPPSLCPTIFMSHHPYVPPSLCPTFLMSHHPCVLCREVVTSFPGLPLSRTAQEEEKKKKKNKRAVRERGRPGNEAGAVVLFWRL